ncbi:MAG: HAD family hydrolase [Candidatus Babeliales bacterium]
MKKFQSAILLFSLLCSGLPSGLQAQEQDKKATAICFDFDDVLTQRESRMQDFLYIIASACFSNPLGCFYTLFDMNKIRKQGEQYAKKEAASTHSTVDAMLSYLKEHNYGDFFAYRDSIIDSAIEPQPIPGMIQLVQKFKSEGYTVLGVTNQTYEESKIYRTKLKNQGIDLTSLFDAIVTTYAPNYPQAASDTMQRMEANVYMTNPGVRKPAASYYQVVKDISKPLGVNRWYFIDDQKVNVEGANQAGMIGIHFALPKDKKGNQKKARNATKEELRATVYKTYDALVECGAV